MTTKDFMNKLRYCLHSDCASPKPGKGGGWQWH